MGGAMKTEIKQLWIAALRSGEYQQGRGQLHTRDRFCCLGVLCDIADKNAWTGSQHEWFNHEEMTMLPDSVQEWAGLTTDDPKLGDATCIALNDGLDGYYPHDFVSIADLIERYL